MDGLLTGTVASIPSTTVERPHVVGRPPIILRRPAVLFRSWLRPVQLYQLFAAALEIAQEVEAAPAGRRCKAARNWWRKTRTH